MASIDAVDPYGLGLLYHITAGEIVDWLDEKASLPVFTIIDALLAESVNGRLQFANVLSDIGRVFGQQPQHLLEAYHNTRQLTDTHKIMLLQGLFSLKDFLLPFTGQDVSQWIDKQDASGRSPLAWAVEYGLLHCVETLIGFGADPNQSVGLRAETSLLHLAFAGPATGTSETAYINISAALLSAGANINTQDAEGWTPLHIAASWGSSRGVKTLANDASLDWCALTKDGEVASELASRSTTDAELISFLQGCETNASNRQ
ncbi:hypothetical protein PG985_005651 [Apiospora marii]|uniref:uncharacterized protein n=1 Tax=Apiospora marii TaxID=335849 RepID=UPI00312CE262